MKRKVFAGVVANRTEETRRPIVGTPAFTMGLRAQTPESSGDLTTVRTLSRLPTFCQPASVNIMAAHRSSERHGGAPLPGPVRPLPHASLRPRQARLRKAAR